MATDPQAIEKFQAALDYPAAWNVATDYGAHAAQRVILPAVLAAHEALTADLRADRDRLREEIAAKDAEIQRLKTGPWPCGCTPSLEDWRGANEDWRKR